MNENLMDYDKIVEDALRIVVKKSLEIINEKGLPGDHQQEREVGPLPLLGQRRHAQQQPARQTYEEVSR